MQLMHPGLRDFLLLGSSLENQKIGFLSLETTIPDWFITLTKAIPSYSIGLQLRREYRHISMALRAFRFKDVDTIFVFEIYNQHLFFSLPLLMLSGKELLIGLHGNQQLAMTHSLKYAGLLYLKQLLNFSKKTKVLLFEVDDDVLSEGFRMPETSKIIIPHPIVSEATPKLEPGERLAEKAKIKIGVVGIIRKGKPIYELLEIANDYVLAHPEDFELAIGTPLDKKPEGLEKIQAVYYDTTTQDQYMNALREVDILLVHYEKDLYYYRTSGVVSDAGACGCYVIASDFPVIAHQVHWPTSIGATFSDFETIPQLIDQAANHIRLHGQDAHWAWRKERTHEAIAKMLFPHAAKSHSSVTEVVEIQQMS